MAELILSNGLGKVGMQSAVDAVKAGRNALDVAVIGCEKVEADPSVAHVGRGGAPNMLGIVETDAAVMDGDTRNVGAIGGLRDFCQTVWLAREVMHRTPHTFIVGQGALDLACECGLKPEQMLTESTLSEYEEWKQVKESSGISLPSVDALREVDPQEEKDTVVFIVKDSRSSIATATSTSGWGYKYPGRLGDSPVCGAGFYADSRYGACVCTHTGEMTTRATTASRVVRSLELRWKLEDAVVDAVKDLAQLREGYLGEVVVHAINKDGETCVISLTKEPVYYWAWDSITDQIQKIESNIYVSSK